MKQNTCPLCGSKELKKFKKQSSDRITLGEKFFFEEVYFKCLVCHEAFDLLGETDRNYRIAEKKAQKKFVKKTIEELNKKNISMSFFERVFELPIRTLSRWKSGDFSFVSLALLRIVKTYPWLTDVAEHKFEEEFARDVLIQKVDHDVINTKAYNETSSIDYFFDSGREGGYQTVNG
ncbi:MAG: hypothetical protein ABIH77_03700 [Pseudomonadota bacterium]|nr:hypothetical protein [Gammaproteobacteria bacterium]MBU1629040.1 hypothetical protein [Gammaproteobacteria bacterium]MBU1926830.1 hypothetical protein [Gammaproteobacteria bacterium]MBU2546186.1 hypothetical protein [Gammaproteobacteria bacterium]